MNAAALFDLADIQDRLPTIPEGPKAMFEGTRFILTDTERLPLESRAAERLERNLAEIQATALSTVAPPILGVSPLEVPEELKEGVGVFLLGSATKESSATSDDVVFKQHAFYSLCWNTPSDAVVIMPFSAEVCGRLEWWTHPDLRRALLVVPAFFRQYHPLAWTRQGLYKDGDSRVAVFVPISFLHEAVWKADALDVPASITAWLGQTRRILTFGTFIADLELDVMSACCKAGWTKKIREELMRVQAYEGGAVVHSM